MDNRTANVKFWIEGVAMPIMEVLGTFGNLLAIAVLVSKKFKAGQSMRVLAILLAVFDTLVLITQFIYTFPGHWSDSHRDNFEYVYTNAND